MILSEQFLKKFCVTSKAHKNNRRERNLLWVSTHLNDLGDLSWTSYMYAFINISIQAQVLSSLTQVVAHAHMRTHITTFVLSCMHAHICMDLHVCALYRAMRGVRVSMSAFLACHQCYCAGSSLAWGLNLWALVCGIFWSSSPGVFSGYSGFYPSFIGLMVQPIK